MKATIGAVNYEAQNCVAIQTGNTMLIQGMGNSTMIPVMPYIAITVNNYYAGVDTVKFDSTNRTGFAAYYTNSATHMSKSGLVFFNTVSSMSLSGTFQFTCADSTEVTSGTFVARRMY